MMFPEAAGSHRGSRCSRRRAERDHRHEGVRRRGPDSLREGIAVDAKDVGQLPHQGVDVTGARGLHPDLDDGSLGDDRGPVTPEDLAPVAFRALGGQSIVLGQLRVHDRGVHHGAPGAAVGIAEVPQKSQRGAVRPAVPEGPRHVQRGKRLLPAPHQRGDVDPLRVDAIEAGDRLLVARHRSRRVGQWRLSSVLSG
jgi:hypothetical protein